VLGEQYTPGDSKSTNLLVIKNYYNEKTLIMDFTKVSNINQQIFLRLVLGLFTEYRSAKIKKNGNIIFWNFKRSMFNTRNVISFTNLIFKYIPLQLSYCKWRNYTKYNHYIDHLDKIFNSNYTSNQSMTQFNDWFINELDGTISIDLSSSKLEEKMIKINRLNILPKKGKKNHFKFNLKKIDLLNPYIERVKNFDGRNLMNAAKITIQAAVIATFIKLNVMFTPIAEREIELPDYSKKDYFTEQLFVQKYCTKDISLINIDNKTNTKNTFFDSS